MKCKMRKFTFIFVDAFNGKYHTSIEWFHRHKLIFLLAFSLSNLASLRPIWLIWFAYFVLCVFTTANARNVFVEIDRFCPRLILFFNFVIFSSLFDITIYVR